MVEAMAQLGGIALLSDTRFSGCVPLFGGIDKARFRRQVVPGDVLDMTVELDQLGSSRREGPRHRDRRRESGCYRINAVRHGPPLAPGWLGRVANGRPEITWPQAFIALLPRVNPDFASWSALRPTLWKSALTSRYFRPRRRPQAQKAQSALTRLPKAPGPRWARL